MGRFPPARIKNLLRPTHILEYKIKLDDTPDQRADQCAHLSLANGISSLRVPSARHVRSCFRIYRKGVRTCARRTKLSAPSVTTATGTRAKRSSAINIRPTVIRSQFTVSHSLCCLRCCEKVECSD